MQAMQNYYDSLYIPHVSYCQGLSMYIGKSNIEYLKVMYMYLVYSHLLQINLFYSCHKIQNSIQTQT